MSGPHHRKLWLWRNFVDGVREYWAFDNAYPCRLDGGDPLVLGEPCGYAVFIESAKGRDYDDDGVLAAVMRSNAYHFDDELGRLQAEVSTLRQRAERAEARTVELEAAIKRQAAAALAGMNATKAVSSWEIQEARRLKAECSPASIASQREANERLTNDLEAAQSTIAELRRQVEMIDKERIELAKMLLHYARTVPLGNQPHMSAEIAEKMALVALEKTRS